MKNIKYQDFSQLLKTSMTHANNPTPMGAPLSFDWAVGPVIHAGNAVPDGWLAVTGWAQVFWATGAVANQDIVQIQNHKLLMCAGDDRQWYLLQDGAVEGAVFNPDFAGNVSAAPEYFYTDNRFVEVKFPFGKAFHFWPKAGRASIPVGKVHGLLCIVEARVAPGADWKRETQGALMMGVGADYWTTKAAAWDNYKTNKSVGISRFSSINSDWQMYGLNTATDNDLLNLFKYSLPDLW